jgi:membrane protein YqaA with SNARE-associated domain
MNVWKDVWRTIKQSKQYTYLSSLGIGFWLFILITFSLGLITVFYVEELFNLVITKYSYLGIFLAVLIVELLVQPTGPDIILIFGIMASLNPWFVIMLVLTAMCISFIIAYYIGQKIGLAGVEKITGKKSFTKMNSYTSKGEKWFMFLGALTPIPYIPYLAGVWNFSKKDNFFYIILPRALRLIIVFLLSYILGIRILEISLSTFL